MFKCYACGVPKEMGVLELSPHREEDGLRDEPIEPLIVFDCAPMNSDAEWRAVIICLECYHRLQPDLWINEAMWASLEPVIPFAQLPFTHLEQPDKGNPAKYPVF